VVPTNDRGPFQQLIEVGAERRLVFVDHEGEGRSLVIEARRHPRIASNGLAFQRVRARGEHQAIFVERDPNRRDVRAAVGRTVASLAVRATSAPMNASASSFDIE
jgi:hypothetical protein